MFMFEENKLYRARDLLNVPIQEMINSPEAVNIQLEFDDGVLNASSRETIISRFAWELYKIFPYIRVLKTHHVPYLYGRSYKKDSMSKTLITIKWDCTYECHANGIYPSLEESCLVIPNIADQVALFYTGKLTEYCVPFQCKDFIEMANHPTIHDARAKLLEMETVASTDINVLNGAVEECLKSTRNDIHYRANPISKGYYSSSFRVPQYYKNAGVYGIITDVDNHLFRHPVLDNLMTGLTNIRDLYMESRTASMSLFFQKDAMRQSEYLTRMLQLLASCVFRVVPGDCGTTDYMDVWIDSRNQLKQYKGIWFYNEETGKEEPIEAGNKGYLAKQFRKNGNKPIEVKIRNVFDCKHHSRTAICAKCFGQLSDSLFREDNIGMLSSTVIQRIITQSILSNKHNVVSSHGERNQLSPEMLQYIDPKVVDWDRLWLARNLRNKKVTIKISDLGAKRIQDVMSVDDVTKLMPARLTGFNDVIIEVGNGTVIEETFTATVGAKDREAYFTHEMLDYMRENGWSIGSDKTYAISMDKWDWDKPFIGIPMVQYSTPAHMLAIKSMLTTTDNDVDGRRSISKYPNPKIASVALHELIKKRLSIHFSHIQVLVLAYLCEDPDNFDYRIPKDKSKGVMRPYNQVMINRDMSLAMAYEKQFDTLKAPLTYVVGERHPHPHSNAMRG